MNSFQSMKFMNVSIPHRYDKNLNDQAVYIPFWEFQSLIGTIKTKPGGERGKAHTHQVKNFGLCASSKTWYPF